MTPETVSVVLAVLGSLGILGGIGWGIKAFIERQLVKSQAARDDATAADVVAKAARELIDPLRKELAQERAEHAVEIEEQRAKVRQLSQELDVVQEQVRALRSELAEAHRQNERLRDQLAGKD